MAHNRGIHNVPRNITHSAPIAEEKDLHSALCLSGASHQAQSTLRCCVIHSDIYTVYNNVLKIYNA